MKKAEHGDTVKVECQMDSAALPSAGSPEPFELEFTIGDNRLIPGLEQVVLGMQLGKTKRERIPATEAFGERRKDLIFPLPSSRISDELELEIGKRLSLKFSDGQSRPATVMEVGEDQVVVDVNHPLAGEDLVVQVTLISFAA